MIIKLIIIQSPCLDIFVGVLFFVFKLFVKSEAFLVFESVHDFEVKFLKKMN